VFTRPKSAEKLADLVADDERKSGNLIGGTYVRLATLGIGHSHPLGLGAEYRMVAAMN
jgi:hypothetical protein